MRIFAGILFIISTISNFNVEAQQVVLGHYSDGMLNGKPGVTMNVSKFSGNGYSYKAIITYTYYKNAGASTFGSNDFSQNSNPLRKVAVTEKYEVYFNDDKTGIAYNNGRQYKVSDIGIRSLSSRKHKLYFALRKGWGTTTIYGYNYNFSL